MIEVVFAILMISNGQVIEYVPTNGMADCLEQKRIVSRQIGEDQDGISIQCKQVKAEIEIDMGDRKRITKIIE
ncbi:MAG TPA: hypothetical protein DEG69_10185 [Flavobacteriaceae bacterium]|jgi:hypothetical protein|nr:hypothetical protein [Flavobacteriaceae bacterium]|tara:strand:- start:492 stop:710 length:219 start_codon:yes stop_codon:yes gene_type:complete